MTRNNEAKNMQKIYLITLGVVMIILMGTLFGYMLTVEEYVRVQSDYEMRIASLLGLMINMDKDISTQMQDSDDRLAYSIAELDQRIASCENMTRADLMSEPSSDQNDTGCKVEGLEGGASC